MEQQPIVSQGLLTVVVTRSRSDTPHSLRLPWTSDQPEAEISNWQETDIHASNRFLTHDPSKQAGADPRLGPRGHWERLNQ